MTPDEYQELALRTNNSKQVFHNGIPGEYGDILHAVMGMCTEAGEIQDNLKRFLFYGKSFDKANVIEECGDVLWYVALALKSVNCSMEDCMKVNIAKLKARYPNGFETDKALNRDLEGEKVAMAVTGPVVCSVCASVQVYSPSGVTCKNGHGGADSLDCECGERVMQTVRGLTCKHGHVTTPFVER